MSRVIIGIHGLGNKPDPETLRSWWEQGMMEGLKSNGYSKKLPQFEMVYWADIIYDKPLDVTIEDTDSPYFVEERYTPSPSYFKTKGHPFRKEAIRFIGQLLYRIFLNEDLTLNYSFIPSYFIRKYFKDLDVYYKEDCVAEDAQICKAKELIKQRLVMALEKHRDDEILLVSHSMGSIVAFDVASFLAPGIKIHGLVTLGSPLGLPIIISKIAKQYKHKPRGKKEMVTPSGIYGFWYNHSDILDKITFNYMLNKRFSANQLGIKPIDFDVVNDYHSAKGEHNPHKSYGYLRTKKFAEMLNKFLAD